MDKLLTLEPRAAGEDPLELRVEFDEASGAHLPICTATETCGITHVCMDNTKIC